MRARVHERGVACARARSRRRRRTTGWCGGSVGSSREPWRANTKTTVRAHRYRRAARELCRRSSTRYRAGEEVQQGRRGRGPEAVAITSTFGESASGSASRVRAGRCRRCASCARRRAARPRARSTSRSSRSAVSTATTKSIASRRSCGSSYLSDLRELQNGVNRPSSSRRRSTPQARTVTSLDDSSGKVGR